MRNIKKLFFIIICLVILTSCTSFRAGAGAGVNVGLTFDKNRPIRVTPYAGIGAGLFRFF